MASSKLIDIGVKLGKQLGANTNKFLGTRSNINFLGKGPDEGKLFQQDINTEVLANIELKSALPQIETSLGYLTAGKLNDIQANKLIDNLTKMNDFYYPITGDSIANVTDMASRTGGLTRGGLESLRGLGLKNLDNVIDDLPPPGSRGGLDDIAAPVMNYGDKGSGSLMSRLSSRLKGIDNDTSVSGKSFLDKMAEVTSRSAPLEETAIMKTIPKNEIPGKTASAREFLLNALKDENVNRTVFRDVVSPQDLKAITEGGGGVDMDPIVLVQKYFGPRVAELLPSNATVEEVSIFTQRILNNTTDAKGLRPTDPGFDKYTLKLTDDVDDVPFADGGRANYRFGGLTKSLLKKLNTKKIKAAVDDIFPSGDYKYDAEMAAESLVEMNPKLFGGQLYDDLDDMIRSDVYGLVLKELSQRNALKLQATRAVIKQGEEITSKNFGNSQFAPRSFKLNVEKAMSELNIPKEEAERIARLSSDEQKAALQTYLDRDLGQRFALSEYNPKKFDAAKGGLAKILEI